MRERTPKPRKFNHTGFSAKRSLCWPVREKPKEQATRRRITALMGQFGLQNRLRGHISCGFHGYIHVGIHICREGAEFIPCKSMILPYLQVRLSENTTLKTTLAHVELRTKSYFVLQDFGCYFLVCSKILPHHAFYRDKKVGRLQVVHGILPVLVGRTPFFRFFGRILMCT